MDWTIDISYRNSIKNANFSRIRLFHKSHRLILMFPSFNLYPFPLWPSSSSRTAMDQIEDLENDPTSHFMIISVWVQVVIYGDNLSFSKTWDILDDTFLHDLWIQSYSVLSILFSLSMIFIVVNRVTDNNKWIRIVIRVLIFPWFFLINQFS